MTQATALAEARELKAIVESWDVPCSIELVAGRGGDPWATPRKYHRMHHHTVSTYRVGGNLTPVLALCKVGRSDVPGPLCNGYGGYDGVYRIICMGLANHPGAGGPITIDGVHIPRDSARQPTWGTEWEGGLQDYEDITIPRYRGGMLEFMGRADAALAEWSGRPLTSQMEHKTWAPTRKVDRRGFDRARGIELTRTWSGAGGEDDMPSAQEVVAEFASELRPGQQTDLRDAMADLINGELNKRAWGGDSSPRPLLVQAQKGGPVYVLEGDRGGRWLVRGWDNVRALVAFYSVSADGEEDGHPKPWPIPQTVLDAIPETTAPTPSA